MTTSSFHVLPTLVLNVGSTYHHPPAPPVLIHANDPALSSMQDLKLFNAVTIHPDATIPDAEMEMRACHTHLLLVVDQNQNVMGLLSSEHLLGERPLKIARERKIKRAEIPIRAIMNPREKIAVFDFKELQSAKIGDVVESLHALKQHVALIVEVDPEGRHIVRGLYSLHQLSKQLGQDVTFDLSEAHSIYELNQERK